MIGLIQRVTRASVRVGDDIVGQIGPGLLALVAVERGDTESQAARLAARIVSYRVFEDPAGRMNLSLADTGGGLLLVSQFTLAADTRKGARPSFAPAAEPETGRRLFDRLVAEARASHGPVETGRFGARMQVSLVNDGPVTFSLRVDPDVGEQGIHSV
ncbi:D-aminoacyl-tRNA deacylase [Wenzhouxiangella sp. XN24]|uniref:D-aminoacyl-tRNA deacylase n=1 Tax=Wenzhouxiangella sp. XN24 TaxID=2713569 RepID=UPI0013EA34FD|nr:D-aminoacyl-tRNA deacylase [Wenzhouxiangella sp. XN24]NGX17484.1 D-tyrosyl-tRNA(Tyr) deacylase [Wenzhouxiangella sp. XN24]